MALKLLVLLPLLIAAVYADPTCGKNEVFNTCGSTAKKTCSERDPTMDKMCHAVCECKEDHVTHNGECIPTSDCKKHCGKNEEFQVCGNPCEAPCHNPTRSPCKGCEKNACRCKKGYVRDLDGSCTLPAECMEFDEE